MKEIELIYKEEFTEKEEARARELYLKSATGRRFLKNILF
jgi:predicted GIY-YIG superfamily endonuclease